jgi:hypothetical protein
MGKVGADILSVITESLYDRPIVVFREYIQNSADSIISERERNIVRNNAIALIWKHDDDLYFFDNGGGIDPDQFVTKMTTIGSSDKKRENSFGYKGIGRLSGLSYCEFLEFYNICSYKDHEYQKFVFSNRKFSELKNSDTIRIISLENVLSIIGELKDNNEAYNSISPITQDIDAQYGAFNENDNGFLVVLHNITYVLSNAIQDKSFIEQLSWLLPVRFKNELCSGNSDSLLFLELNQELPTIDVLFEGTPIERPIQRNYLRDYTWAREYDSYAIGFHTVNANQIAIGNNPFRGIRIYIDNMLLCDETELIPILQQFGMIKHTTNELIQSVRGIGAIVYIKDKINIVANARRTFIEVTETEAIQFLKLLANFVEEVLVARYALSDFQSAHKKGIKDLELIEKYRVAAQDALQALAEKQIIVSNPEPPVEFPELNIDEQRRIIKRSIIKELGLLVNEYLRLKNEFHWDSAFRDFYYWMKSKLN